MSNIIPFFFYFYFFKLLEKSQVLVSCAITEISSVVGDVHCRQWTLWKKESLNSCHSVINAWQGLWNEFIGYCGIIRKVRDPTLHWKTPQLLILDSVHCDPKANSMKTCIFKGPWERSLHIYLFISAVKLFWHGKFSRNIGREVQYVIPMVKINSFTVYNPQSLK